MIDFDIVVAADEHDGIGRAGQTPWQLSDDLRRFRSLTLGELTWARAGSSSEPSVRQAAPPPRPKGSANAVVMGRKTWQAIPPRRRPLPQRLNVVLTSSAAWALPPEVLRCGDFDAALHQLAELRRRAAIDQVFVVGGGQVYQQALSKAQCRRIYLTRLRARFDCDTFFPTIPAAFGLRSRSSPRQQGALEYAFEVYEREAEGAAPIGQELRS